MPFYIANYKIKKLIKRYFSDPDARILDLGCGEAPWYHSHIKGKITGFDIRNTKSADVVGDADKGLPFRQGSFDSVISINSLYYFSFPLKVMRAVSKILKKNGMFFAITPFMYPIHDIPDDKYRFTEYGLRVLLSKFNIKRIGIIGGIFNIPAVLVHSAIKLMEKEIKKNKKLVILFAFVYPVLFLASIVAQIFSLLDFFDVSRRWPTYYYVIASKK